MLGFKSLEQKLRDGNGRTAPATVLGIEDGKSLNWKSETGPHGTGNYVEEGVALSKNKCRLRVKPEGEPEFDAVAKVSDDDFLGAHTLRAGSAVIVLFDPDDHERLAIDVAATKAQQRSRATTISISPGNFAQLASGLTAAATGPAAPDVTEQLTRLADLRDRGALTEEEFAAEKAKLLGAS
jgi:hypothetical protein